VLEAKSGQGAQHSPQLGWLAVFSISIVRRFLYLYCGQTFGVVSGPDLDWRTSEGRRVVQRLL